MRVLSGSLIDGTALNPPIPRTPSRLLNEQSAARADELVPPQASKRSFTPTVASALSQESLSFACTGTSCLNGSPPLRDPHQDAQCCYHSVYGIKLGVGT